ncbi:probable deoxyhypusine synthase [Nasonia vitripennis]|uniref:deoxyhypusine synthase n=1 Tax=Nasonia vitripennis TaxID=7425 RepID=A0A7M7Q0Q1_NASVI|nr:probable deoxyhypusine synthase [Nasonia vitripennis]
METQKSAGKNGKSKKKGKSAEGSKEEDYDSESSKVDNNKKPILEDSEKSDKEQESTNLKKGAKRKKKSKKPAAAKGQEANARKSDTEPESSQANTKTEVPVDTEQSVKQDDEKKAENVTIKDSKSDHQVPESLINNVLKHSAPLPSTTPTVKGYDFNDGINYSALFRSYKHSGFQATNFGLAVEEILRMLVARRIPLEEDQEDNLEEDEFIRRRHGCTIFLGYTSNMASCGVRETIRFLAEHRMIDCIVTTAGGVEEDFIKCLAPTYVGDFHLDGKTLRDKGINRIGNLLVPNDNYCLFEDWVMPILDKMLEEQKKGVLWTPSKVIARLGEEINNRDSIYYWAAKNKIPVFSPALTDGSLGDMMYFHSFKNPGLVVDIVSDLRRLNTIAMKAIRSGVIIIGGGVVKHHICNANLMRNGADFGVFLNTASEYDGSDSGARPDEAVSWGKIRKDSKAVKIFAEASLVFPLLVAETFVPWLQSVKEEVKRPTGEVYFDC